MAKYIVKAHQVITHNACIEADSEEEALEKAKKYSPIWNGWMVDDHNFDVVEAELTEDS